MDKTKVAQRVGMALGYPIGLALLGLMVFGVWVATESISVSYTSSAASPPSSWVNVDCGSVLSPADPPEAVIVSDSSFPGPGLPSTALVVSERDREWCSEALADQRGRLVPIGVALVVLLSVPVTLFIIVKRRERRRRAAGAARLEL